MKRLFALPALAAALLTSVAAEASNLLPYLVFSRSSIQSQQSDYLGNTGAVGDIQLQNFLIRGALYSGNSVEIIDGNVTGETRTPRLKLVRATARRARYDANIANHLNAASAELSQLAMTLSSYPATSQVTSAAVPGGLRFTARQPLEVIDVDATTFANASNLVLEGNGSSLLLIRVRGNMLSFRGKGITIAGGINASQIVFFFPEALSLDISYTGGAVDPYTGAHLGLPGAVVAPNAAVHFAEALITGELYVGQLCTQLGLNGGQVNFSQSILLRQALQGGGGCPPQPYCNSCCR